jgi:hypothetical protein
MVDKQLTFWPRDITKKFFYLGTNKQTLFYVYHTITCYCLWGGTTQGIPYIATITDLLCFPIWVLMNQWILIHPQELPGSNQHRHQVVKNVETYGHWIWPTSISFILQGSLTCRKILLHGTASFTSPPKEVVLQMFITHIKSTVLRQV